MDSFDYGKALSEMWTLGAEGSGADVRDDGKRADQARLRRPVAVEAALPQRVAAGAYWIPTL
jgi:hypothetical protein